MKYIAAYALLALNKEKVTKDDLTSLLQSMGVEVNPQPVDQLINSLEGMPIEQAISLGMAKLDSMNGNGQGGEVEEIGPGLGGNDSDCDDDVEDDISMTGLFDSD